MLDIGWIEILIVALIAIWVLVRLGRNIVIPALRHRGAARSMFEGTSNDSPFVGGGGGAASDGPGGGDGATVHRIPVNAILLLLGVVVVAAVMLPDNAFGPVNLGYLVRHAAQLAIVTIGMVAVIRVGGIDLSVGSVAGLSGVLVTTAASQGWPPLAALALALGAAAVVGAVNGSLVARYAMPSYLVTLAMLSGLRALSSVLLPHAESFDTAYLLGAIDTNFAITVTVIAGVALAVSATDLAFAVGVIAVACLGAALTNGLLRQTDEPLVGRTVAAYVFCAVAAGIFGILFVTWAGNAGPFVGIGVEVDAIAAALLGGASIARRAGSVIGALVGALALSATKTCLLLLHVPSEVYTGAVAVLLLVGLWGSRQHLP